MVLAGAVSHQALSAWRMKPIPARSFVARFRSVNPAGYTNAVAVLYVITWAFGLVIYPQFVLDVKQSVADFGMRKSIGLFQIKEHVAVMALGLLPVYWHFWKKADQTAYVATRRVLTSVICAAVWWNLVVGHLLNNVKGLL